MSVVEPPDRRRRNIVINTYHCRQEVDTVQYVISKYGYRETRQQTDGNILYYGLALRDNDVELIKIFLMDSLVSEQACQHSLFLICFEHLIVENSVRLHQHYLQVCGNSC